MRRADSTRSNTSSRSLRPAGDSKQQEDLINALEAEEERLVNTLTRKLEKLRAEKAELENVLEAESESLVLRLQRQLSLLMQQQQSSQPGSISGAPNSSTAPNSPSATISPNLNALINHPYPLNPSPATVIEALKSENLNLRTRLVDTEREFIRTTRLNELYRNELIALRQRAGLPIEDLIGTVTQGEDCYSSARVARRRSRGTSTASGNGISIPALSASENHRRSHHAPSFSSSSAQLSFASSTPMTPNSLAGESAHLISASMGTSLTTPSTSYPGLPVPHSTPAASPANDRPNDYTVPPRETLTNSTHEVETVSSPTDGSNPKPRPDMTPKHSPSQPATNRSRDGSLSNGRIAETGILPGNRGANSNLSPLRGSGTGAPGGPENRQQFNFHQNKDL